MKKTLFSHLFVYILGGSISVIALFSFLTFQITGDQFDDYLSQRFIAERESVVETIETAYIEEGVWDEEVLSATIQNAMHSHILVSVEDAEGNEIISQTSPMRQHMQRMRTTELIPDENWLEEEIGLFSDGANIGTAVITYPGLQDYTAEEEEFLQDLTLLIFLMGILSVVIAGIVAYLISKRLSKPIADTSKMTQKIARGENLGAVKVNEKISELYHLQESVNTLAAQLAEQKLIRNQIVSDLAHEVRTPLTTLQGNIEAMIDGVWEVTPERLTSLDRQVKRLAHLVQMIDQLEDAEASHSKIEWEDVDIKALLSSVIMAFEHQADEKGISLILKAEPATITADRNKLDQVFSNLLSNALKFTPEGGEIIFWARRVKDKVIIKIKDNGQGIPQDKAAYVFERFYQVEASRNSELQGQGIGLAVVKSLVEAHKGTVEVESEENVGTTFTVTLPIKND
ncbi:sensor histidine kinase [Alkalibacterium thalassium]|uniref:histidine kinase n=1 Tax=Alkalibacterium thalassium TaxID=426701 RepID=A0A1G9D5Z6_9LACT|nr:HAMP domain-containing sensor histidine kinase [Alkalibacterium thalassium]SDK59144.1 Signal transduction histidine kinase [Alkalibacterium thalassium]